MKSNKKNILFKIYFFIFKLFFSKRYFSQIDLLENVPKCMLLLASIYFSIQLLGFLLLFENREEFPSELSINDEPIAEETNSLGVK
jgi:hypothetical protein